MKLATAYVEIAARTDEFRRQLREVQGLAAESARNISRSLQPIDPFLDEHKEPFRRDPARPDPGSAVRPGHGFGPLDNQQLTPRTPGAHQAPSDSRIANDATFWKQQLELERKQLDVLQKQLEILKELRQGVPAVLT